MISDDIDPYSDRGARRDVHAMNAIMGLLQSVNAIYAPLPGAKTLRQFEDETHLGAIGHGGRRHICRVRCENGAALAMYLRPTTEETELFFMAVTRHAPDQGLSDWWRGTVKPRLEVLLAHG
ncbi:hypothetical protein [Aestuariicoccus sp. MJ-SS9]|uniref:hypothetical protein n=1 Tax=Aestuariicoccus sp. MJ-SS9 TaxID=3079855 RepID=UPI00290AAF56|nr:hypothetical protein [Aestuariicoccus sp. MJ-SS9]MDU8911135.1 hypothetical protein [Aestuariicoccus sp. MJ-SS9]